MFKYSIDINFLTKIIINIHLIDELFFIALITIIRVMTSCAGSFLVVSIANSIKLSYFYIAEPKPIGDKFSVELSPMMIRTFEVTYQ